MMTTISEQKFKRNPFRAEFSAWGDRLDIAKLTNLLGDGDFVLVSESKGEKIQLSSGKERTVKTGRFAAFVESSGSCDEVLTKLLNCISKFPEDIATDYGIEKMRLACWIYTEADQEDLWELSLKPAHLRILVDHGIELVLQVMP